ncbi:NHLP bacteriocin export ABC transporter permease/ATPase subunit [Legionella maioricensis]|uniref:NHLP bacteriocin export ABC transporter permease/ATPase subunit n=1 Tax=Legionella maioricensis TaxID=2896528 RepID=A0A9X2IBG9_9GAMM|nr:NHLP bacteriocin export ABC transporter permease/ATPase subunit [Legionella maioricensis]MCL9684246.1 NHLP bacteriocin export ABC transporter permease/ATPase subunit [Legionella maioricensis]MCL9687112.1 NHLP bacteriocin export ABC transporter permease/ATPase subunit [Legionella maioricensis]
MDDYSAFEPPVSREFDLHELNHHFQISSGVVDVFLVHKRGKDRGRRHFLGQWNSGNLLIGLKGAANINNIQLIASCSTTAKLLPLNWDDLALPQQLEAINKWKDLLIRTLISYPIQYSKELFIDKNPTPEKIREEIFKFYEHIKPLLIQAIKLAQKHEMQHLEQRKKDENNFLRRAYLQMLSTLQRHNPVELIDKKDSLTFCVQNAAQFFNLQLPHNIQFKTIQDISQLTGMQIREVELKNYWWLGVTNPLLLRKKEDDGFCLGLPKLEQGLTLFDPHNEIKKTVTKNDVDLFSPTAWQLYCPLPQKKLKIREVIAFAFKGCKADIGRLLLVGSLAALLSLVSPWFTGILFEQVVPSGSISQLKQITWALLTAAFAASLFELVRAITVLRIGSRLNLNMEIAIWDRLIRLPVSFFRKFSSGDLVQRAMAASRVRHIMAGVVINSLLSGVFSLFSFALLFYYDMKLALTAMGIITIISIYTLLISIKQLSLYQYMVSLTGELSGLMVQLLAGISKIQTSGREKTAFSLWAIKNSQIKKADYRANWYSSLLSSLNALCLPLLTVIIFAQFINQEPSLNLGVFLAFNAALGQFTAGVLGLIDSISTVINSIPLMKRTLPIIESLPEIHTGKRNPGVLLGKLEADQLRFSYSSKEHAVIQDVSFVVEPGQYVAITGPSGSGKSTLLRLLLGFEKLDHGNIFFDDHDMKQLNIRRVREQCGVVLQSSFLMPGTLFENIVGSAPLSQEDAWHAAEMAGLAEDIRKMPMGMHTIISERGGSLSGGQRQRVLIARALAKKPKIIFFDEATSSLDNNAQSIVIESLEQLKTTRVVIAHRLSTIEKADLILVMNQGKIIQTGTYSELMKDEGLFQIMANRQLFKS